MIYNNNFNQILDNLLNKSITELVGSDFSHHLPAVNITESDEKYCISLAAPGLDKSDFHLKIEENLLTIHANKEVTIDEKIKVNRKEFSYNKFKRQFTLPKNIDKNTVDAVYSNGVLVICLAKIEEEKPKSIKIEIL